MQPSSPISCHFRNRTQAPQACSGSPIQIQNHHAFVDNSNFCCCFFELARGTDRLSRSELPMLLMAQTSSLQTQLGMQKKCPLGAINRDRLRNARGTICASEQLTEIASQRKSRNPHCIIDSVCHTINFDDCATDHTSTAIHSFWGQSY